MNPKNRNSPISEFYRDRLLKLADSALERGDTKLTSQLLKQASKYKN
jgi:hypothetical protein